MMINTNVPKYNPLIVYSYDLLLSLLCSQVKGYFFVASAGRAGSLSLSRLFKAVHGSVAFHEPYPIMYDDFVGLPSKKKPYFHKLFYAIKRINIKRAACGYKYYLETNHQFIKTFSAYAIDCFKNKTRIIFLKRDPVKIAASLYAINSIPGKSLRGKLYLLDPLDDDNLLFMPNIFSDTNFNHDYYRCLWYCYEIEARMHRLKKIYPEVLSYDLHTEDLNDITKIKAMFSFFDLPYDQKILAELIGIRANIKTEEKIRTISYDVCNSMADQFLPLVSHHLEAPNNLASPA